MSKVSGTIVADSSYIVERLLERRGDWGQEELIAPDFAVPEVVNAVLAQQSVLHSLKDGTPYVESLFEAIDAASLRLVSVTKSLVEDAYGIALRNGGAIYDCIFVALALRYGSEMKTNDRRQEQVLAGERSRGVRPHFR
jgi:predicted nucleic acid-binding protein